MSGLQNWSRGDAATERGWLAGSSSSRKGLDLGKNGERPGRNKKAKNQTRRRSVRSGAQCHRRSNATKADKRLILSIELIMPPQKQTTVPTLTIGHMRKKQRSCGTGSMVARGHPGNSLSHAAGEIVGLVASIVEHRDGGPRK